MTLRGDKRNELSATTTTTTKVIQEKNGAIRRFDTSVVFVYSVYIGLGMSQVFFPPTKLKRDREKQEGGRKLR